MPELPPPELYAAKLRHFNHGYALFEPDPNGAYDRVRVGDVGYITDDGKFIKLFNAFHAEDSPENDGANFPANFEPIAERYRRVDNLTSLVSGPRLSESVRVVDIGGNLSVSGPIPPPGAGASIGLSCTTRSGAALITKYIATRQKALSSKAMEDYMIKNGLSWLQIARNLRLPVEMHDLVFVREHILTGDWATITWDKSTCDSQISFNIGVDGIANAALSYWGQWEDRVSVPKRQGLLRSRPIYEDYPSTNFDQCIFLKGLRIVLREWYERIAHFLKIRATDAGEFDEEMSRISTIRLLKKYGFKIETIGSSKSSFRPVQNVYDIVAIFVLEETNADIAIIDDNDIVSLQINTAGTLEEVCDVLLELQIAPVVVFTTHDGGPCKVGKICWDEPEPSISSMTQKLSDGLIILDENYEPVPSETEPSHLTSENSLRPIQSFEVMYPLDMSHEDSSGHKPMSRDHLRNLPSSIQVASAMFEEVSLELVKMAETRGVDETRITQYRETWATHVQELDEIVISMYDITTKGAEHIKDFIKTYRGVLTDETVRVRTKIEKLEDFLQKLLVVFGEDAKDLSGFAKRVMALKRNVEAFGLDLSINPPHVKKALEAKITKLQSEISRIRVAISSSRGDNGRFARLVSSVISSRVPELTNLEIQLNGKKALESELRGTLKEWFNMTGECYEKIISIKNQLLAVQHVWLALRADSQALLIQLKLITEDEQAEIFNRRLGTLQIQYMKVYDEFYSFTHNESIAHRSPQPKPEPRAQKSWLEQLSGFFFQPNP